MARVNVTPLTAVKGCRCHIADAKRRTIEAFENCGQTSHSSRATTLQWVIDHCEETGQPYRLTHFPGHGFHIEKFKSNLEMPNVDGSNRP
jgi:hypothetical protein